MPKIKKPEKAITKQETRIEKEETKEEMEKRVELLLEELEGTIRRTHDASRDEDPSAKNARFGLGISDVKEIRELLQKIKE